MRLRRVEQEFQGRVELIWRSFLLRPEPDPRGRDLEKFRAYTRSWLRPAAEPDAGEFRVWEGDTPPPSHSIPAHLVAKAAAAIGRDEFRAIHERLLHAYFAENRNVTDPDTLLELWRDAGLAEESFAHVADRELVRTVIDEHNEAVRLGVSGVPAVRVDGDEAVVLGAHPLESYRRWVGKLLDTG